MTKRIYLKPHELDLLGAEMAKHKLANPEIALLKLYQASQHVLPSGRRPKEISYRTAQGHKMVRPYMQRHLAKMKKEAKSEPSNATVRKTVKGQPVAKKQKVDESVEIPVSIGFSDFARTVSRRSCMEKLACDKALSEKLGLRGPDASAFRITTELVGCSEELNTAFYALLSLAAGKECSAAESGIVNKLLLNARL